jgi:hypothetical protein
MNNTSSREIIRFFGFRSEAAFLQKSINVPAMTKLEWLEEYRKSLCLLPVKRRKRLMEEVKHR